MTRPRMRRGWSWWWYNIIYESIRPHRHTYTEKKKLLPGGGKERKKWLISDRRRSRFRVFTTPAFSSQGRVYRHKHIHSCIYSTCEFCISYKHTHPLTYAWNSWWWGQKFMLMTLDEWIENEIAFQFKFYPFLTAILLFFRSFNF